MAFLVGLDAPRKVRLRRYETPAVGEDEVRVRTLYSGISAGTELSALRGTNPYLGLHWDTRLRVFSPGPTSLSYPLHSWGYSEVGVVEDTGRAVAAVAVGDTVWGIWGHRSHAVLAEDALTGHRLTPGLDPLVGTFARVGAVALNAVLGSQACIGETVAVFGQGVIGLLATQLLRTQGCEVLAVDTMPRRLELAAEFGAMPLDALAGDLALSVHDAAPEGVDRVIELSGAYPALHQAVRVAGPGGTVTAAGFYQGGATALALGEEFHHNQVTISASQIGAVPFHLQRRWTPGRLHTTAMNLCASGRLQPLTLVSHIVDARSAPEAYALIDDPPDDLLQVVLDFTQED